MAMSINTNVVSLNAQRNLSSTASSLATSMQRLSSGLRVNSAKDDAAGLAIAERMGAQVRGMNVAIRNANDGISLAQTAEGALGKIGDMLQRMRELAVQSRNATNSDGDRANLQKEFTELQNEIGRVIKSSNFNGKALFDSNATGYEATLSFQVGANTSANDRIDVTSADLSGTAVEGGTITSASAADEVMSTVTTTAATSGANGIAIGGWTTAPSDVGAEIDEAINVIDRALEVVNDQRATFGAVQNRFEAVIQTLQVSVENQSASRGRILDADFAAETANLSRAQILQQAGVAMVSQANQLPQQVLSLLR
ncbi:MULTISPECIES: flagellin [Caldimonas]|uniref:flagellin N-terminal helical domain-containing protein n=1 Tax=Caldimonas TaxID=196013 RepID=UPI0003A0E25B|nr:flagellin [Caldimonas manganoxidans]